ncbi:Protein of unknown function [Bacillus cytotoxicus]|nr:Protein of unknown function [Bacillus cytotoxicus]
MRGGRHRKAGEKLDIFFFLN